MEMNRDDSFRTDVIHKDLQLIHQDLSQIAGFFAELAPALRKFAENGGIKPSQIVKAVLANGSRSRL